MPLPASIPLRAAPQPGTHNVHQTWDEECNAAACSTCYLYCNGTVKQPAIGGWSVHSTTGFKLHVHWPENLRSVNAGVPGRCGRFRVVGNTMMLDT